MHIPDGFVSPKLYLPATAAAGILWAFAVRRVRHRLRTETIPTLAVLTALAFILMLIALPLPGGTSAHASGIALLAVSFGVWTSFLSISLVLLLQALLFGMGGITSLAVNALAMGIGGGLAAVGTFQALRPLHENSALIAAGWFATVVPALLLAGALGVQPLIAHGTDGMPLFFPFGLAITVPAVLIPHALLGIGEGILTLLAFRMIATLGKGESV